MSLTPTRRHCTAAEYLRLEKYTQHKHEYFDGCIYPRVGVDRDHALIASNAVGTIGMSLRKSAYCTFGSDIRIEVAPSRLYTYPTISIVGKEKKFLVDLESATLCNPFLIVEVDSLATPNFDRSAFYLKMPSLNAYVKISEQKPRIECYTRQSKGGHIWRLETASGLDSHIYLDAIGMMLALRDIYEGLFEADSSEANDALFA